MKIDMMWLDDLVNRFYKLAWLVVLAAACVPYVLLMIEAYLR